MSTFSVPNNQKQIRQVNRGDTFGELWATFNIDLTSSPRKIKVSKKLSRILDETFLNNDDIQSIIVHDGFYYVVTIGQVFKCSADDDPTDSANWTEIATLGLEDLGFETDAVSFLGLILISLGTDIMSWDGSTKDDDWWTVTVSGTALTASKPHIMHVHRGGQETLFVTDSNKIRYYNATAGHSTITLDDFFTACCVTSGVSAVWVGTYTEVGDAAYVYEIYVGEQLDSVPVARNAYKVDGRAVLSIEVIDNIPYIVTEKGTVQSFNGAGFSPVAYFPFAYGNNDIEGVRAGLVQDTSISRPIHPKGMKPRNRSLLIAINTEEGVAGSDPVDERTPSGVWEFNVDTGVLNHRQSLTSASTQYGYQRQRRSGPLFVADNRYTTLLVAGETGLDEIGLFGESDETPQGYIITPEIESETVRDTFEKAVIKARTLAEDERIVLKYMTEKDVNFPQYNDIVWLNATQFNTTDTSFANVSVGDEIEITEGYRAGYIAHITDIEGTTTRTVTISESIGLLNETSRVRVLNWTLIDQEYLTADGEVKSIGVGEPKAWIKYKVQMTGDIELRQFISKGNSKEEL